MKCALCGKENDLTTIGFKAVCPGCGRYLHSCVQCRLFDRKAERCRSLTTEAVRDRTGINYCEEYMPGNGGNGTSLGQARESSDFDALFGGGDREEV